MLDSFLKWWSNIFGYAPITGNDTVTTGAYQTPAWIKTAGLIFFLVLGLWALSIITKLIRG